MKKIIFVIFFIFSFNSVGRETGQIEITTNEGIEVFQKQKYYLLKDNVKIFSDNFELEADLVRAYFEKDLYDIINIESEGNVSLLSKNGFIAKGEKINFSIKKENILILGIDSSLIINEIKMYSNKIIEVDNVGGNFNIKGESSMLETENILIKGNNISGKFLNIENKNEIEYIFVEDDILTNITTKKIKMSSIKASYNKKNSQIELFDNVRIIRNNEIIEGDYANINTLDESYKVISNNKEKVKILISNGDE